MGRPPRRSLSEALEHTRALHALRQMSKARVSRAQREALAPKIPDAAIRAYTSVMATYADRTSKLVERRVLSALPVVGSGDPLDLGALERGLQALQVDLDELATKVRRSARAAAKRSSAHARREVGRVLGMQVPLDAREAFAVEAFEHRQVELLRATGRRQVERIRKAIADYHEGDSMRRDITHALWVSRNHTKTQARTECLRLHRETVKEWALFVGSAGGFYCTAHDERVRKTHAAHDGKYYAWGEEPSTLQEPGCRCRMLPVEGVFGV